MSIFFTIQGSGFSDVSLSMSGYWDVNGYPLIGISSDRQIASQVELRSLLYPSGTFPDTATAEAILSDLLLPENYPELVTILSNSGWYFDIFRPLNDAHYNHLHTISYDRSNTYYNVAYYFYTYDTVDGLPLFQPKFDIVGDSILAKAPRPQPDYIQFPPDENNFRQSMTTSIGFTPEFPDEARLIMNIPYQEEIPNYTLSDPAPYGMLISELDSTQFYDYSGNLVPYLTTNYFDTATSGMLVNLPYDTGQNYEIVLFNIDQEGVESPWLTFNTEQIKKSSDDFDAGQLGAFTEISLERIGELEVTGDLVNKKRLSVGIDDIAVLGDVYSRQGVYISRFYTIDNPVYTFSLDVNEFIPDVPNINPYDMVKYYVEFQNQDWIRISPINRNDEYDENSNLVPKFIVLDNLGSEGVSPDILELPYDFSVYSLRLRIEFDLSDMESDVFITPEIRSYKCNVADRSSFFRV